MSHKKSAKPAPILVVSVPSIPIIVLGGGTKKRRPAGSKPLTGSNPAFSKGWENIFGTKVRATDPELN